MNYSINTSPIGNLAPYHFYFAGKENNSHQRVDLGNTVFINEKPKAPVFFEIKHKPVLEDTKKHPHHLEESLL